MIGALSFIGMLLVMGGVERNPGPDEKYVFRYQYLLIQVGTYVLRMVFDHIVGPDFKVYLDNNPDRKRDFNNLLSSRNKPTTAQLQLLPPIDNSPSSDKFDITLLTCLLRNACGLSPSNDPVWLNPQPTDQRVEAYITRLKQCRNDLAHSGSVLENETVLTTKWRELCLILQELSSYCGFGNLQAEIKKAESAVIDDKLKEKFENDIKEWRREIAEVRSDIGALTSRVEALEEPKCKTQLSHEERRDIQRRLIKTYQEDNFSSLPMCPLLEHEKGNILRLYEIPTMYAVNYHKVEKQQTNQSPDKSEEVKTCSDLFRVKGKDCKNIYLTGDAGVGKTSFCKFLSLLWCKSKLGEQLEESNMQQYIDYLKKFQFVFYVNLRDTHYIDLIAIVVNELFFSENNDKWNKMYSDVETILENHDSLVIMDGLDEWIPKSTDKRYEIPVRPISLKCVYLTTCRPYKIENVRLSQTDLDHQVQMTGLGELETKSYVEKLISLINTKFDDDKNQYDFYKTVEQVNMSDQLNIPMVTSHLVMLWFDRPLQSMTKSIIYGNIMDMLFKLAHNKGIYIQQSKPSKTSKLKLPDRLSELEHFKDHFSLIEQLCLLSYNILFEQNTDITCLVFTRDQLAKKPYSLSEAETDFFCKIGILSMKKILRKCGPKECKLSFLHKSYLEFFAAIYVSNRDTSDVLKLFSQCRTINDVLKYENFLIFYAGLYIDNFVTLITRIYSLISKDLDLTRVLTIFSTDDVSRGRMDQLLSLQDLILECKIEGSDQIGESLPLEDFIFDGYRVTDTKSNYLKELILSHINNVRLLWSDTGEYFDEFDEIINLKGLHFNCDDEYDSHIVRHCREFKELIKKHKSSLQIISINTDLNSPLYLPLDDLHYLTSLSLRRIYMSHEDRLYLTKFLSNNSQLKHVSLISVDCTEHRRFTNFWGELENDDVCGSFELVQCNELVYLHIENTNIVCTNINTSSLEYIELEPKSKSIARSYINIVNSIQNALELKFVDINGEDKLDDHLVVTLITNVQYLSRIESIKLKNVTIRDNVSFLLHPSVKKVSITLDGVNMTAAWFQRFIESVLYKHCKLQLYSCINADTNGSMFEKESFDYLHDYIKSKSVYYQYRSWPHDLELVINGNQ